MAAGLKSYSLNLLFLVIDFPDLYKIVQCNSKNKSSVCIIHWEISINSFINSQKRFTVQIILF